MDKEMLKILNDLSKKSTTELALKIMELSSENLILEQQCKKQKEVIEKASNKINNMFDRGDANTIIDDLLELDKILKGSDSNVKD